MRQLCDLFGPGLSADCAGVGLDACFRLGRCFGHLPGIPCVRRFILYFLFVVTGCGMPVVGFVFAPLGGKGVLMCRIFFAAGRKSTKHNYKQQHCRESGYE